VDGAHNGDSMQKLIATLADLFRYDRLITILGVSADKDIERMLDAVLPAADHILVTKANHPRAADPEQLARRIRDRGGRADAVPVENVLQRALSLAGPADLVCGTGSLFLVAALRAACFALSGQPLPPSDDE
jgi:dihydrofolate synthase/folylpolyglutamate synthase